MEKHNFLKKFDIFRISRDQTILSQKLANNTIIPNRKAILIAAPSSFGKDDFFEILIDALDLYEHTNFENKKQIIVIFSGSGPMKKHWKSLSIRRNSKVNWSKTFVMWFEYDDYEKFLSVCDIGLSADRSRSKLDLMYKVINLKSHGVPSLMFYYDRVINEQVKHNFDGLFFGDDEEGLAILVSLNFLLNTSKKHVEIASLPLPKVKHVHMKKEVFWDFKAILKQMGVKYNLVQTVKLRTISMMNKQIKKDAKFRNWDTAWENALLKRLKV